MITNDGINKDTQYEVVNDVMYTQDSGFEGYQITEYKQLVWYTVREGDDIDNMRRLACDNLKVIVQNIGANAVVNFKMDYIQGKDGHSVELSAVGEAVVIKQIENYVPVGSLGNILAKYSNIVEAALLDKSKALAAEKIHKSPVAEVINVGNATYIECPECGVKYNVQRDAQGKIRLMHFDDVDASEPGCQIYCTVCGAKFTIPEN